MGSYHDDREVQADAGGERQFRPDMGSEPATTREKFVPVTLGSPRFRATDVGAFRVTEAWFPPGLELPPHVHERPILGVMLDGSFDDAFVRRTYACPAGTVFTEPGGERHANQVDRAGARVLVVQPDPDDVEAWRPCAELFDELYNFRHARIAGLAGRLATELDVDDDTAPLLREGLVLEMLGLATRLAPLDRGDPPGWLRPAVEFIHDRFRDGIRVDDIAAVAGVHPVHFARVFRQRYGETVGVFVRRLRVEWAQRRIAETDDPLATIAQQAGYADQSHLTRAFRRHFGITPGRYRDLRG